MKDIVSEEVEGEDGEGEEKNEEASERVVMEEDDDMEEEDSGVGYQVEMMNPLDFVNDDASGGQLYEQFMRIDDEALAQSKRKQDNHQSEVSAKKLKQDESAGATFEEIKEAMSYGSRRRRRSKRGRKKNKASPEVTKKLGDATLHFAHGRYEEAISVLNEVVLIAPALCDPYHTLGLVFRKMGNEKKAINCYMIAAFLSPETTSLWKLLVNWSIEEGNFGQAWYCLSKAKKTADKDITLKYLHASLLVEAKDYKNAADKYNEIVDLCPYDVQALENAVKFYKKAHHPEGCISILEKYIKNHPPDSNPNMINLVASLCIENNEFQKALTYIEHAKKLHFFGEEAQLTLTIKEGICHAHLRNFPKAEDCFNLLQEKHTSNQIDLVTSVVVCLLDLELYESALKYYPMLDGKVSEKVFVHLKVAQCYIALKNTMFEDFVDLFSPLVCESLSCLPKKVKYKKHTKKDLLERAKILEEKGQTGSVFQNFRPPVSRNDWLKATRAKKKLEERATLEAGHESKSDDSDEEILQPSKEPPLPALFEDEKQYCLFKELCRALTSLGRYNEALKILKSARRLSPRILPTEKKEELCSLNDKIAFEANVPSYAIKYARKAVVDNPHNIAAWNCYYKLSSRLENGNLRHYKLLHDVPKNLVPRMIIRGNHFTERSEHQSAARKYLGAYKLMPENSLVNLCAGTSLINVALGFRIQNRHQCVAQGLAFLYHNLLLCGDNNQEALYNIGRAYQHVGLVTLAASYYEKVLAIREKSYSYPEIVEKDQKIVENLKKVNCDLRREAAFNLHLIYKNSGAIDLARQVLKDHISL